MCVCVSLHTDYTRVGVLGKDVCGRSERRRRLCDIQIETAVFLHCVYVCETLLRSVDGRNSYRGPAACEMCQRGKSAAFTLLCGYLKPKSPRRENVRGQQRVAKVYQVALACTYGCM